MALTDSTLQSLGTHLQGLVTHLQLHSAAPGAAGTTAVTSAARQAVTWDVDADGDLTLNATAHPSGVQFTGGAANGACTYVSLWSASTGGTFRGSYALTGDQTFNSSGQYTITSFAINGTST